MISRLRQTCLAPALPPGNRFHKEPSPDAPTVSRNFGRFRKTLRCPRRAREPTNSGRQPSRVLRLLNSTKHLLIGKTLPLNPALSMNLKVGRVCPQRAELRMPREEARWIHIHENLSISRRFCGSEARRPCLELAVVRLPAYIRSALRTTLPTSLVPAMPAWGQTRPTRYGVQRRNARV